MFNYNDFWKLDENSEKILQEGIIDEIDESLLKRKDVEKFIENIAKMVFFTSGLESRIIFFNEEKTIKWIKQNTNWINEYDKEKIDAMIDFEDEITSLYMGKPSDLELFFGYHIGRQLNKILLKKGDKDE